MSTATHQEHRRVESAGHRYGQVEISGNASAQLGNIYHDITINSLVYGDVHVHQPAVQTHAQPVLNTIDAALLSAAQVLECFNALGQNPVGQEIESSSERYQAFKCVLEDFYQRTLNLGRVATHQEKLMFLPRDENSSSAGKNKASDDAAALLRELR